MMASPTATSAAATAMIKNTNTCPDGSFLKVESATKSKLMEFNINSTDMKMIMAFLLIKTPKTPMQKSAALR